MNKTGFDIYSGIKVENTNEKSPKFDDIDSKSLEDQEKIRYSQDTKFRRHLTLWVMIIIPLWLYMVFQLLCKCANGQWHLSNTVLFTLFATTTANILGLANIVLKGMFLKENKKIKADN